MTAFNWLHLTDLHRGMAPQTWMLPQLMKELHRDLRELHAKAGPWDAILFTGDLTQRARPEEFDALDATLADLRKELARLGSDPVLLAVPGNHDLSRPENPRDPAVRNLRKWKDCPDIHEELWNERDSPYRRVVDRAFAGYLKWRDRAKHGFRKPAELRVGTLPGDFSAVIEKDGIRLGVVGLNTALLHLSDEAGPGGLAIHTNQFHEACGGNGAAWADRCDVALLMTHHPPSWLDASSHDDHLREHIAPAGRFAVHLFGHMHEGSASSIAESGAEAQRLWQGPSLFGLEKAGPNKVTRAHGYTAGRIEIVSDDEATLRLWPRRAEKTRAGDWQIVNDTSYRLTDLATRPERFARRRAIAPTSLQPILQQRVPQPAGGGYDPEWYVARPREERMVLNALPHRGSPAVIVWGPPSCGKTTLVKHVMEQLPAKLPSGRSAQIVTVSLSPFGAALQSEDAFLFELGTRVARAAGKLRADQTLDAWPPGAAREHLQTLFETRILPGERKIFVLVIEALDTLLHAPFRESVLEMFRFWVQSVTDPPWSALRIVFVASTGPVAFVRKVTQSPLFNAALVVELGDLTEAQTLDLVRLYALDWDAAQIQALRDAVGGHPLLLRHVMYEAAQNGTPLATLLDKHSPAGQSLRERANQNLSGLDEDERTALRRFAREPSYRLDDRMYRTLRSAGVLEHDASGYRFRCGLYREHFEDV